MIALKKLPDSELVANTEPDQAFASRSDADLAINTPLRISDASLRRAVEYALTPLSLTLIEALHAPCHWAEDYVVEVVAARGLRPRPRAPGRPGRTGWAAPAPCLPGRGAGPKRS